jgi:hypothetical protein
LTDVNIALKLNDVHHKISCQILQGYYPQKVDWQRKQIIRAALKIRSQPMTKNEARRMRALENMTLTNPRTAEMILRGKLPHPTLAKSYKPVDPKNYILQSIQEPTAWKR